MGLSCRATRDQVGMVCQAAAVGASLERRGAERTLLRRHESRLVDRQVGGEDPAEPGRDHSEFDPAGAVRVAERGGAQRRWTFESWDMAARSPSFSPVSGMWAAMETSAFTFGWPAAAWVMTAPP